MGVSYRDFCKVRCDMRGVRSIGSWLTEGFKHYGRRQPTPKDDGERQLRKTLRYASVGGMDEADRNTSASAEANIKGAEVCDPGGRI
jgi:hypothetical protein